MKVIFLDFDGVILTLRTKFASGKSWSAADPDPVLVAVLKRCCAKGVKLVISSTWRDINPRCHDVLKACGLFEFLHKDWRTGVSDTKEFARSRPEEVHEWIKRHTDDVDDYRILDDEDWRWDAIQALKFLKCDAEDGASARVLKQLLEFSD